MDALQKHFEGFVFIYLKKEQKSHHGTWCCCTINQLRMKKGSKSCIKLLDITKPWQVLFSLEVVKALDSGESSQL